MTQPLFFKNHKWIKRLLLHLLFWLIIITYFAWGFGFNVDYKASFINALFYLPGFVIIVYSLLYFLIPRYLTKKKYWSFFAGLVVVTLICKLYNDLAQLTISANEVFKGMTLATGRGVLPFIHVAAIAISVNLVKYWYEQKQQTIEAQQQKTAAELELLKSQVHPHFLFNTLNNLYAHILDQSPLAPEIVLKLSSLLRFMIYESSVPVIPLAKEITLLQEYISLEQLRYGDRLDVSVSVSGHLDDKQITPLLMLPLVENAFKHGTSNQTDQCWISFDLHVTADNMHFKLVNSKDPEQEKGNHNTIGIGLKNVKRRLDLLYTGKYTFTAEEDKDVFIVNLHLQWDKKIKDVATTNIDNQLINKNYEMEVFTG